MKVAPLRCQGLLLSAPSVSALVSAVGFALVLFSPLVSDLVQSL